MSSSSDEDDEMDPAKLAALRSVAIDSAAVVLNASAPTLSHRGRNPGASGNASSDVRMTEENEGKDTSGLKLYQTRLQDLLYKHLDKTVGASFDDRSAAPKKPSEVQNQSNGADIGDSNSEIRLFRRAPPGIVVRHPDHNRLLAPTVRPELRKPLTVDEDSDEDAKIRLIILKRHKQIMHFVRLQATVVDGESVKEQAERIRARILASAQAAQAKVESATQKEEARVAELKRERGEEWLPAIAAQMCKPLKLVKPNSGGVPAAEQNASEPRKKKKKKKKNKNVETSVELESSGKQNSESQCVASNGASGEDVSRKVSKPTQKVKLPWPQVGIVIE